MFRYQECRLDPNEDHFGLKAKGTYPEFLAVHQLVEELKDLFCAYGTTRLALHRQIHRTAMGREFVRMSLGSVRMKQKFGDTVERISEQCQVRLFNRLKAGSSNPVFLLDEIDKMSTDFRDPASALLVGPQQMVRLTTII